MKLPPPIPIKFPLSFKPSSPPLHYILIPPLLALAFLLLFCIKSAFFVTDYIPQWREGNAVPPNLLQVVLAQNPSSSEDFNSLIYQPPEQKFPIYFFHFRGDLCGNRGCLVSAYTPTETSPYEPILSILLPTYQTPPLIKAKSGIWKSQRECLAIQPWQLNTRPQSQPTVLKYCFNTQSQRLVLTKKIKLSSNEL